MATLVCGLALAVVADASSVGGADRGRPAGADSTAPAPPVDTQLLLDLDLLRDPEFALYRSLLERLRMIESLRLLERLNLFESQTSTAPTPSRDGAARSPRETR